jgi:putative ABC transport system substrate-binding protein
MRRRDLMLLVGGVLTAAREAPAQDRTRPLCGYLSFAGDGPFAPSAVAFRLGLSEIGYIDGQNLTIEYRWAEGRREQLPALVADLVGRRVDIIVTGGGPLPALAAKNATSSIPIVFEIGSDPVAAGLVASLARPGSNLTGITFIGTQLGPKQLQLVSELAPQVQVVGAIVNADNPVTEHVIGELNGAAQAGNVQLEILKAASADEIETAFATLVRLHAGALLIGADPFFFRHREQLVRLAARNALPAIYFAREFAEVGGLISYGASISAVYRQVGSYAGRILKGSKPADLPVQRPTTFELVINLKTAKALGLTIPPSILIRANEVVE